MDSNEFTEISLDADCEALFLSTSEESVHRNTSKLKKGSTPWTQYPAYNGYAQRKASLTSSQEFSRQRHHSNASQRSNHYTDLEDSRYDKFDSTLSECSSLPSDSQVTLSETNGSQTGADFGNPPSRYRLNRSKSMPQSGSSLLDPTCEVNRHLDKRESLSSMDGLLFELYDRHGDIPKPYPLQLDGSTTECSSLSEANTFKSDPDNTRHTVAQLSKLDIGDLKHTAFDLTNKINQKSSLLVKCLRNREKHRNKAYRHCNMITAVLQAWSSKTSSDSRMKFSIEPVAGEDSFEQWKDSIRALIRRPIGLPEQFRHRVWLALSSDYISGLQLNWSQIVQFAFNDKCNPDDDALGNQIVKDLHRTGCSSYAGDDNAEDRVLLQRVLLGYARWNKVTGYCQGFNILAALILRVTHSETADALKVMVYLVDKVLPKDYFSHNLRALTVDMAVFRSYLGMQLPRLSAHLVHLQHTSDDQSTGANVEPPLTNVFTMQWLLTAFASSLPRDTVLRVWDCVLIDGNEILLRTALVIWTKLAKHVMKVKTADEFYVLMGKLTHNLLNGTIINTEDLITNIYKMAPLPLPKLTELREKYMYDITPFSAAINSASHKAAYNTDDEFTDSDLQRLHHEADQSMDIDLLKNQYRRLIRRQKQAFSHLSVLPTAMATHPSLPPHVTPVAMNHLFIGRHDNRRPTRKGSADRIPIDGTAVTAVCPNVTAVCPNVTDELATRLDVSTAVQQMPQHAIRFKYRQPVNQDYMRKEPKARSIHFQARREVCQDGGSDSDLAEKRSPSDNQSNDNLASRLPKNPVSPAKMKIPAASSHHIQPLDGRLFNPFPRPLNGLLSAEKAQHGIKLGLYKPKEALAYMDTRAKRQLLERVSMERQLRTS